MSSRICARLCPLLALTLPLVLLAGCSEGIAGGEGGGGGDGGTGTGGARGAGGEVAARWELVFADEFDSGTALSAENWTIETGYGSWGWGNDEWQLYTDSPHNIRVEDGNLVISAQCPEPPCGVRDGSVTSGRMNSLGKFSFKFGRVQARIKPPVGKATWPAFWGLGANFPSVGWPRSGEIDFMEMHDAFSNDRTTHFTVHWCEDSVQAPQPCTFPEGWVYYTQQKTFDSSLGDDFHVFEAELG